MSDFIHGVRSAEACPYCGKIGATIRVIRVRRGKPRAILTACAVCYVGALDSAFGWRLTANVAQGIASRAASLAIKAARPRLKPPTAEPAASS